jgi:glucose-6-phosphate 1-dehydrogenase
MDTSKIYAVDRAVLKDVDPGFAWMTGATLSVVVLGATGDLAKKKTFPALLNLFLEGLIPKETRIFGFGRTKMAREQLHERLRPNLLSVAQNEVAVDKFLEHVFYHSGSEYGSVQAMSDMVEKMEAWEESNADKRIHHRLFYFAVPPDVYAYAALAIAATAMHDKGFNRIILEKPLGMDLPSFQKLNSSLCKHFDEDKLYRIDHYLGKEIVQNISVLRFSNRWLEKVWNRNHVQCVVITFKDVQDVAGRGGYFDKYGIIRDIIQNHLLQILCLVAMEAPATLEGPTAAKAIRDAKVAVLNAITDIKDEDVMIGQYEGYLEDPSVENKQSNCATFAAMRIMINTPRWEGVPFILKAGKAMDNDKAEIRIQFKDSNGAKSMFLGKTAPRNEFGKMHSC